MYFINIGDLDSFYRASLYICVTSFMEQMFNSLSSYDGNLSFWQYYNSFQIQCYTNNCSL